MKLKTVRQGKLRGKRVLVRTDYNVEVEQGKVRDLTRLQASRATIDHIRRAGGIPILISHRGRPKRRSAADSLRPIVRPLERVLRQPVRFISTPLSNPATARAVERLRPGDIALLENIRFAHGEETNSATVAKQLARLGDIYVNDAFSASHRAHASISAVTKLRPAFAGLALAAEVDALSSVITRPRRPMVAVIGGAKISTKLGLVKHIMTIADHVLLGGALANTVLQAEGLVIGRSLSEPKMVRAAKGLTVRHRKLAVPVDVIVQRGTRVLRVAVGHVGDRDVIVDIGPETIDLYGRIVSTAKTIVWNGPMGKYETKPFDRGTKAIAGLIAKRRATSVAGGGETLDAIARTGTAAKFTYRSTGGGAMLEFLEGKTLPGLTPLVTHRV